MNLVCSPQSTTILLASGPCSSISSSSPSSACLFWNKGSANQASTYVPRRPSFKTVLRTRDVNPGSEYFPSRIRIKECKYFNPKNCFLAHGIISRVVHPGSRSRIRILIFHPSRIHGSKRHRIPDPQHYADLQEQSQCIINRLLQFRSIIAQITNTIKKINIVKISTSPGSQQYHARVVETIKKGKKRRVVQQDSKAGENNSSKARIFKHLWSPGIDAKASIPPAYVA